MKYYTIKYEDLNFENDRIYEIRGNKEHWFKIFKNVRFINEDGSLKNIKTYVYEVEVLGETYISYSKKIITNKIKIIREVKRPEYPELTDNCFDKNGNEIYFEDHFGYWEKRRFDKNNNLIYRKNSLKYWERFKYDEIGNETYYESSDGAKRIYDKHNLIYSIIPEGFWQKWEFDEYDNVIYWENSDRSWTEYQYDNCKLTHLRSSNGKDPFLYEEIYKFDKKGNKVYVEVKGPDKFIKEILIT